jgi:hypothetical protein
VGKGWNGQGTGKSTGSQLKARIDIKQEVVAEIREVLAGRLDEGVKEITVALSGLDLDYLSLRGYYMQQRMRGIQKGGSRITKRGLPVAPFALQEGTEYLFFLNAPRARENDGNRSVAAAHLRNCAPLAKPDKELLLSMRAFCRELKLWHKPPELSPEQQRTVTRLLAELGAEEFPRREKADRALRAIGAGLRPQLEAAAKDDDEERSFRAAQILKAVRPEPGKVMLPGNGERRAPEVFKERPKSKPRPEPPPPDDSDGDVPEPVENSVPEED